MNNQKQKQTALPHSKHKNKGQDKMVRPMVQEIGRPGHFLPHDLALEQSREAAKRVEQSRLAGAAQVAGSIALQNSVELQQAA